MNSKNEHIQPCDVKEKYETSKGNWENTKLAKRTKTEREKLRYKIKSHLDSNAASPSQNGIELPTPLTLIDQPISRPLINVDLISDNKVKINSDNCNPGSRILTDSTNLGSRATNSNSTFPSSNQQNFSNDNSGNNIIGDGQNTRNELFPKASNNSQNSQASVYFPIFHNAKPPNSFQGVKRQRKASASQHQSNTISKYLVNHS